MEDKWSQVIDKNSINRANLMEIIRNGWSDLENKEI